METSKPTSLRLNRQEGGRSASGFQNYSYADRRVDALERSIFLDGIKAIEKKERMTRVLNFILSLLISAFLFVVLLMA